MKNNYKYPKISSQPNLKDLEEYILSFWESDHTFLDSIANRPLTTKDGKSNEYVFYDGPPFANGLPHYGHILTGYIKDAIPRYKTMKGLRVERRFGWDCHGLPAEMAAETELGLSGKTEIETYGVDKFNDYCRSLVNNTTDTWQYYVRRQARWVDMENNYKTMDTNYMESVMWAFKTLYERSLAYEGFRVLPYCWECETPLSNFETRQDDSYRNRKDESVTVRFRLRDPSFVDSSIPMELLVWTTTPWTLPSNLAVAVGEDIDYVVLAYKDDTGSISHVIIAEQRLTAYADKFLESSNIKPSNEKPSDEKPSDEKNFDRTVSENIDDMIVARIKGKDLVNKSYTPIFNYFSNWPNSFKILGADFVTTTDGTGIVHLAPGFGEDDQITCQKADIEVVCPIDDRGRFTSEIPDLNGTQVFEANSKILKKLNELNLVFKTEVYEHSYPHCWRSDTPLIYRALSSWFVKVTEIKDRMVELNDKIRWIPAHVKDGSFGKWLKGARDWSISRNRYWGTPIPVWKSTDPNYPRVDVYGSIQELENDFNVKVGELHRPFIDQLTRPNPDDPTGKSMMVRIPDVLDCWFESGSMPFASQHYPFENKTWFEEHFPADFIVEYIGQVRGWFYTLHVLGTALFDKPPFKTCMTHGIVLGNDGRKLSKRLKNYPDPEEIFNKYGSDAMRFSMLAGPVSRGLDVTIDEKGPLEAIKQVINPLWNAWYFLSLYATIDDISPTIDYMPEGTLDRYILAKLSTVISFVDSAFEIEDLSSACNEISQFLDALTNWFIRRSREKFWAPKGDVPTTDKIQAYNTLHTVLVNLCKIAAPLLPLITESIYKGLTSDRSVHLTDWPNIDEFIRDDELVISMDLVRHICSNSHSIRKANHLRARLPLSSLKIATQDSSKLVPFLNLIKEEINVKDIELTDNVESIAKFELNLVPSLVGPRLGPDTPKVMAAAKSGNWEQIDENTVRVAGIDLLKDEAQVKLVPIDISDSRVLHDLNCVIKLDLVVTEELENEGLSRDIIRLIQQARKDADLVVTRKIKVTIATSSKTVKAVSKFTDDIAQQILASDAINFVESDIPSNVQIDNSKCLITTENKLPNGDDLKIWLFATSD